MNEIKDSSLVEPSTIRRSDKKLKRQMQKFNRCEATRLRRRLISVAHVTCLGCLRQKPSSFENFGCRYCNAFASISSNQNRGSIDSEGIECGIDRRGRENPV